MAEEEEAGTDDSEERIESTTEPREGMSWFVAVFMGICLFMTAAMAYYAWGVFERSV